MMCTKPVKDTDIDQYIFQEAYNLSAHAVDGYHPLLYSTQQILSTIICTHSSRISSTCTLIYSARKLFSTICLVFLCIQTMRHSTNIVNFVIVSFMYHLSRKDFLSNIHILQRYLCIGSVMQSIYTPPDGLLANISIVYPNIP